MCKVSIIGLGQAGLRHLHAVKQLKNTEIYAVADVETSNIENIELDAHVKRSIDYQSIDQTDGLVIVALPHSMLMECSTHFLKLGNHVLIEKPMCFNLKEALDFEKRNKQILHRISVSYVHRFRREIIKLQEWLNDKQLGKLISTNSEIYTLKRKPLPRWLLDHKTSGGGVLIYSAIHTIDMLQWLINGKCQKVAANLKMINGSNIEEVAVCRLEFDNGIISNLNISVVENRKTTRWKTTFYFENGIIELLVKKSLKLIADHKTLEFKTDSHLDENYNFYQQIVQVMNYINNNSQLNIGFEEGKESLRILDNLYVANQMNNQ